MSRPELICIEQPDSIAAEAYRALRTSVQFASIDKDIKTLVITSTHAEEGKSSVVMNLGITISQTGKRVLLVDADLRNPSLYTILNVDNKEGLSTMFLKNEDMEKFIKATPINNLFILCSGLPPPNPSEILASERMKHFIATAREKYDFIIFDSPPLLPVTDAAVLSKACDGTILVIRSNKTVIEAAHRVKTILQNLKINVLGVVLVDVDQKREHYYYYDYKYKYAKEYKDQPKKI